MFSFFTSCDLHCWTLSYISWLFFLPKSLNFIHLKKYECYTRTCTQTTKQKQYKKIHSPTCHSDSHWHVHRVLIVDEKGMIFYHIMTRNGGPTLEMLFVTKAWREEKQHHRFRTLIPKALDVALHGVRFRIALVRGFTSSLTYEVLHKFALCANL